MDNQKELLPVVDDNGNILGSMTRKEAHSGSKLLHPVVHLHLFNEEGQLYLQLRDAVPQNNITLRSSLKTVDVDRKLLMFIESNKDMEYRIN